MSWLRSFKAWYSLASLASFSVMIIEAPRKDSVVLGSICHRFSTVKTRGFVKRSGGEPRKICDFNVVRDNKPCWFVYWRACLSAELTFTASPTPRPPCRTPARSSAQHTTCWLPAPFYLDVFCPVSVLEGVVRVVEENVRRVDVRDHHQAAPPLQRGLEQVGQLAVAVLHVSSPLCMYNIHTQQQKKGYTNTQTQNTQTHKTLHKHANTGQSVGE